MKVYKILVNDDGYYICSSRRDSMKVYAIQILINDNGYYDNFTYAMVNKKTLPLALKTLEKKLKEKGYEFDKTDTIDYSHSYLRYCKKSNIKLEIKVCCRKLNFDYNLPEYKF